MKSITIHNLDESLESLIRERAKKQGLSLNKTIQMMLKQASGLNSKTPENHKDNFLDLYGVWSGDDLKEFNANTQSFNEIDEAEWK